MKKLCLLLLAVSSFIFAQAQLSQNDLSITLANTVPSGGFVVPMNDSLQMYFKITNYGPDDLDTTEYIFYSTDVIPPNYSLVASDSGSGEKVYLQPGESFINHGMGFSNDGGWAAEDTTVEFCFYLRHDFGNNVFYTDTNSNNDTLCFSITFLANSTSIAKSTLKQKDVSLFPNPAQDKIHLSFNQIPNETTVVEIFNLLGQSVYKKEFNRINDQINIDVAELPAGMYNLLISGDTFKVNKKWIKQ